jgi:hypothetical protein
MKAYAKVLPYDNLISCFIKIFFQSIKATKNANPLAVVTYANDIKI